MKKILMFTIASCLSFTTFSAEAQESCCKRNGREPFCKEQKAECKYDVQKQWENFEKLSSEEQKKLIEIRKNEFEKLHDKMAADFKEKSKTNQLTEEAKQKQKELHKRFKSDWKRFDQMSLLEQKAFLDRLNNALQQKKP